MLQPTTAAPIDSQPGCVDLASAGAAAAASSLPSAGHCFRTGDSNRCRSVYEQVLRVALHATVLDAQKKNKHVSIGRCRMLAINHGVALPPYERRNEYLTKIAETPGGFPAYEREHRRRLTAVFTNKFPMLPVEVISHIVHLWGHCGDYLY